MGGVRKPDHLWQVIHSIRGDSRQSALQMVPSRFAKNGFATAGAMRPQIATDSAQMHTDQTDRFPG
jgi:hypothetical protein